MKPLPDREAGPHPDRYDYATVADYNQAFWTWWAIRRDAEPTLAEREAQLSAITERLGLRGARLYLDTTPLAAGAGDATLSGRCPGRADDRGTNGRP